MAGDTAVQKPSVGRVVHFVDGQDNCCSAQVAHVHDDGMTINIGYLDRNGVAYNSTSVAYSAEPKSYTWHWPERV